MTREAVPSAEAVVRFEDLLISGGDTRLLVDAATGLNRYGCSPMPRDVVPFGSCTSSSISARGHAAAERAWRLLLERGGGAEAASWAGREIRQRLRAHLTLPPNVDIALAPSGTDCELMASALAAGPGDRRLVNVIVGPNEVGSGTAQAASALHYDRLLPSGAAAVADAPVDAELAGRIELAGVPLRDASGLMRSEWELDAVVTERVERARAEGAIALLHVVAHSKTGMHAPSLACVERLRARFPELQVIIDAAQGRFSRRGLREILQNGYLVEITGSKFYGGPPFSGALLVPESAGLWRDGGLRRFPASFADYFTRADLPARWASLRDSLPDRPNFGMILRWYAALAEMDAYYEAPGERRLRVLRMFEAEVPRVLSDSKTISILPIFPPLHDDIRERLLESKTTVFGFFVRPPGAERPLDKAGLTRLHGLLNRDASAELPDLDAALMARAFHVGQPVDLGSAGFVLRVALGGELITRVSVDKSLGLSFDKRLDWLRRQVVGLRDKIDALATRFAVGGAA